MGKTSGPSEILSDEGVNVYSVDSLLVSKLR